MGQFVGDGHRIFARLAFSLIAVSIGVAASSWARDFEPGIKRQPGESLAARGKVFAALQHLRCLNCHPKDRWQVSFSGSRSL